MDLQEEAQRLWEEHLAKAAEQMEKDRLAAEEKQRFIEERERIFYE
jgi:hypothetical protein